MNFNNNEDVYEYLKAIPDLGVLLVDQPDFAYPYKKQGRLYKHHITYNMFETISATDEQDLRSQLAGAEYIIVDKSGSNYPIFNAIVLKKDNPSYESFKLFYR